MSRKEVAEKVKAGHQQWLEKARQPSTEAAAIAEQKRIKAKETMLALHAARKQAREAELAANPELAAELEAKAAQRRAVRAATAAAKRQAARDAALAEYLAAVEAARAQGEELPKPSSLVAYVLRTSGISVPGAEAVATRKRRPARPKGEAAEAQQPRRPAQSQQPEEPEEPKPRGPRVGGTRSPEHRAAIAEAIRRKWQDPEYRATTVAGIRRSVTSGSGSGSDSEGGRSRRRSASASDGEGGAASSSAASTRAPRSSATRRTTSRAASSYSDADASRMAEARAMRDPSTVRSTRSSRGGGRHMADVPPVTAAAAAAAAGKAGGRDGAGGLGGRDAGGNPAGATRRRRTTRAAADAAGGENGGDPGKSPDAARLELVRKLVGQVLTAERLVANTEHLMGQFEARQHALRNDPVVRHQAHAHLAAVATTLQQARAKLEALRAKIPRDARYNAAGDVWFVAMPVETSSSSPGGSGGSSSSTWPGSRDALGANGLGGARVHDGDVWVGVDGRTRDAGEEEDSEGAESSGDEGGWRGLGGAAPSAEGAWSRSFLDDLEDRPGPLGAVGGGAGSDVLDVEAQWVDRGSGSGSGADAGAGAASSGRGHGATGSLNGAERRLNGYADHGHHNRGGGGAHGLNGNGRHTAAAAAAGSDYDLEDHDAYGSGGRSPAYGDDGEEEVDADAELADDFDDWDPEQEDPGDYIRLSRRPPPNGRGGGSDSGGGGGGMEGAGPGFGRAHTTSPASTSGRAPLSGVGGGGRVAGAGRRRTAVPSGSGGTGSRGLGPGLGSSLGAFSGVGMPPLGDEDVVRVDLSALDPGNILGFEAVNGHHKPPGGAEPEPSSREGDASAGDGDRGGGGGGDGSGGVLKGGGSGGGRWPSGGAATASGSGSGPATDRTAPAAAHGQSGANAPAPGSALAGGSSGLGSTKSSGSSRVTPGPVHTEHMWIQPDVDGSLPEPLAQLLRAAAAAAPVPAAAAAGRRLASRAAAASHASASSAAGGLDTSGSNISVWMGKGAPSDLNSLKAMLPASHGWLATALEQQQQQQQQHLQQQQHRQSGTSTSSASVAEPAEASGAARRRAGSEPTSAVPALEGAAHGRDVHALPHEQRPAVASGEGAGTRLDKAVGATESRARRKAVGHPAQREVAREDEASGSRDAAAGRSKPRAKRRESS